MGIFGNERADKLAKAAGKRSTVESETLSTSEGEIIVWTKANEQWQLKWEAEVDGKQLYSFQGRVNSPRRRGNKREEQVIKPRFRIRHSHSGNRVK